MINIATTQLVIYTMYFCFLFQHLRSSEKNMQGRTGESVLFYNVSPALQAATILVAMASGKNIWRLKFWRKSPIGDLKRNLLENLSKIPDEFNQ